MNTQTSLTTDRLLIEPLTVNDNAFIFELVNTDGWLTFIGNRNISSQVEATAYIQKIVDAANIIYWVVKLKDTKIKIGIITFIKRDYLKHHDIGFAFLPAFANHGYAYEASSAVLNSIFHTHNLSHILATTIPENKSSIKLLKKLGLLFHNEIEIEKKTLCVYSASTDKLAINKITNSFFGIFTNTKNKKPDWDMLSRISIPEIRLISKTESSHTVYNLASFMEPRQKILSDGTLTEFEEHETLEQTIILSNIAQRHSEYEKSGILEGQVFKQKGNKFLQFIKTSEGWKISSVIWEDGQHDFK